MDFTVDLKQNVRKDNKRFKPEAALPREKSKGFVLFKEVAGAWIKMPKNKVLPSRTAGTGLLSLHSCINSLSAEKKVANESPAGRQKLLRPSEFTLTSV